MPAQFLITGGVDRQSLTDKIFTLLSANSGIIMLGVNLKKVRYRSANRFTLFRGKDMKVDRKTKVEDGLAGLKADHQKRKRIRAGEEQAPATIKRGILTGGGEMGERIRAFDWAQTPLGAIESWSPALLTMVRIMLANRFPLLLWWGPQYISLYNDAYIPVLGKKHPWALGQPVSECWKEIWHILQPLIDTPFKGGPATWNDDIFLEINRYGFVEETHFTIAYSPVPDENVPSGIGGVLATVHEITEKVVGERRIVALRDLGARVGEARTAEEACRIAAETLNRHDKDIPFALLYLINEDGKYCHLAGAAGVLLNEEISPLTVDLREDSQSNWPLAKARQTDVLQVVENLQEHFLSVPSGPWSDPPSTAVVLPIPSNKLHEPAGLMIAGVSARLKFNQLYQDFIELVRTQIAAAVANARVSEEERRRAQALAEIDRAKTAFFSNVSHEFRTPLTLMLGPLEDLLAKNHLSAAEREPLEVAHRNSLRLLKLVNTLLDFSRIEAGRVEANYEPIDLATYTGELASVFRSAIEHADMKLIVNCPPLDQPVYVDREMWEKIVLNLISNAFKFTFEGEIEVSLRQVDEMVELLVRDTGVGIPQHELPHMFERFHRVRGARARTHEGTGIGLALVQELVQLHGGHVGVVSGEDKGTTFTISIPIGTAHLPADHISTTRSLTSTALGPEPYIQEMFSWLPAAKGQLSVIDDPWSGEKGWTTPSPSVKSRILLADDNVDMRNYIQRLLEKNNYEVEAVADGLAALHAAQAHTPDLVLTDIMMPGQDGFALLKELRADDHLRTVPVILVSARAGEEARVEGMQAGAADYLVKPFSARELLARIGAHLEIARIRDEAEKALSYRSAEFETLLNQAPLGVYLVDTDFRIREVNPTALSAFGDIPALIGRDFDEVIHMLWTKEYADEVVRIFRHSLETGESYETPERIEYRIDRNVTEYYEWRLDRIWLPDGRYGVVCYFRDISAQVQAQAKIAESEARYRGIVNQSVGGIAETDPTGRFITVNDRYCEITGYAREELLQLRMQDIIYAEDLPRSLELLEKLASGGPPFEIEKRYIRKDGSIIWVHKGISAIRDVRGGVKSLIAVSLDITKHKKTEEALQQLNLQLESLVQSRTAKLRSVNRSLREEIAERIRVEDELSLSRDRLRQLSRRLVEVQEEERRAIARELHDRAAQTLSALNINLVIMKDQISANSKQRIGSRLDDSMQLTAEAIRLIRNVVSDLRPTVLDDYGLQAALNSYIEEYKARFGIQVHLDHSEIAISGLEPGVAMTVLRIVQEALTNVVRHAQATQVHVSIGFANDMIHLVVQDDGIGLTESQRTGHLNSHGLKIMRERAEAFGGNVNVGLAPGRGTRVEARIPIQNGASITS
jgi:PAS domain S-box-containing protein